MRRVAWAAAVVVLAVGVPTALTEASFALGTELSFEWYIAAVACVAWGGGRRLGLAAAIASSLALDYLFLPYHRFSFGMEVTDLIRLAAFLGIALLVAHLVAARRAAEEERDQREQLLTTAAQELSNTILALRTWTTVLLGDQVPRAEVGVAARALARTTDVASKLAGDLMAWSQVAAGEFDLHPIDLDLAAVVGDAIQAMQPQAIQRGVRLSWSFEPCLVHADRERLHQIALTLLESALRTSPAGAEVLVSVCATGHRGLFSVSEAEPAPSRRPRWQVIDAASRQARTRTLAPRLALSRAVVRAHGGDLTLHGGGADAGGTVTVALPVSGRA